MLVVIENSTRPKCGGDDLAQKTCAGQRIGAQICNPGNDFTRIWR